MNAQKTENRKNYRNLASATYNLDKEPLQTGNKYSTTSLRTKVVMSLGPRFTAGISALVLFLMLIAMGSTALVLFIQVLKKYYQFD